MVTVPEAREFMAGRLDAEMMQVAEPLLAAAAKHADDADLRVEEPEGQSVVLLDLASRTGTRGPFTLVLGRARMKGWFSIFVDRADIELGDTVAEMGGASNVVELLREHLASPVTVTEWRHRGIVYRLSYTFHGCRLDEMPEVYTQIERASWFKRLEAVPRDLQAWL